MEILKQLESLREEINELRPIPPELEAKIIQKFRLDWNYHSNSIEGNKLTFGETKTFLLHGITADGKPLKDHLDIKGHNNALLLLEDIVKEERPIAENFIRELHKLILQEDYYNDAITPTGDKVKRLIKVGQYKQVPNHVKTATGEIFHFASPEETPAKMSDLMQWLNEELGEKESSLVVLAALFHYKFIRIHPFDDGNGRLARILMNLLLMRGGYPPAIVKSNNKDAYYTALQKADGGDEQSFVSHIASVLKYSMILYLKGASGEDIEEVDDVDKEFELLKMMVEGKDENIVLSPNTISLILDETIAPLLDQLSKKVFKCNEFYHKHAFGCGIENLNGERLVKGERKFEKVDSLNSFFKEIKTVFREGMKLALSFQWQDFKREKDGIKKYNYYLKLEIRFGDTYCTLNQLKEGKLISLQRYYYHKNIEEPSKEVANKLLKEFMTHIKNNMAE